MHATMVQFRDFLHGLSDQERGKILSQWKPLEVPDFYLDPFTYFWNSVDFSQADTLAEWLKRRGDDRLDFVRFLRALASWTPQAREDFGRLHNTLPAGDRRTADAFLQDMREHPGDASPWLIFADWLEERNDPRTVWVRALAYLRPVLVEVKAEWLDLLRLPSRKIPRDTVYQDFGEPARRVFMLANQEAQRFNHEYIGTQHILLAMLHEEIGAVTHILNETGIRLSEARKEVEQLTPFGPAACVFGKLPQSMRCKMLVCNSMEEADWFGHRTIRPEHLLLALCRVHPCVGTRVLHNLGVSLQAVCEPAVTRLRGDFRRWLWARPEVW